MKKWIFIFFALYTSCLFAADTLEVFAFRVQFKEESPDNSLTTGTGLFNSSELNENYSLDPNGKRGSVAYWRKHFEFANEYYKKASNGKQVIKYRIFPEDGEIAYQLDKYIIDYNRTAKRNDEKVAEYNEARSRDYMTFIFDAIKKIHNSKNSPFKIPLSENPDVKRAYMIIHAGASRLVDGGSMGTRGANTPGDFMDVYVSPDYWAYLPADSLGTKDSVTGLPLKNASIDTLKEVMVVSETSSQDGLNWGINGILVNQIGRALGLPNTYDIVKGISRLGYFDVMDFAGYSAGNGFFPVLPSAWLRYYMGWARVQEITPKMGSSVAVDVGALGTNLGVEIVKVPLSANEYLLIENRQRSLEKNGDIEISLTSDDDDSSYTKKIIPADSLSLIFEDSTCVKGKCSVNRKKAKGIISSVSSFDAALPGSGIVVWKVNEWYLKEALPFGVTNFWGGDTLRDHQYGISLIEADNILTVGKTFKNALGQDAFDYGSGSDLIPHLRVAKDTSFDTVFSIKPSGYGNTGTVQGGYTGIKISAKIPENFRKEKNANLFFGDSVLNFASPVISVNIEFEDFSLAGGAFPKSVGLNTKNAAAVFLDYPGGTTKQETEKLIVFGSDDGTIQVMNAYGSGLTESDTSIQKQMLSNSLKTENVELYRLSGNGDSLIGLAGTKNFVFALHQSKLQRLELKASLDMILSENQETEIKNPVAGPLLTDSLAWILSENKIVGYSMNYLKALKRVKEIDLPANFTACDFAYAGNESFVVVSKEASVVFVSSDKELKQLKLKAEGKGFEPLKNQKFSVVSSDFNRDEIIDAFVLGSYGYAAFISLGDTLAYIETPRQFNRGKTPDGKYTGENSPATVSDINNDGYPEVVFLGLNRVYALNYKGIPLNGFPITISKNLPETYFESSPLLIDVTGDAMPEILVPTPGGVLYAYTHKGKLAGKPFPLQAGTFEYNEVSPMSVFVANTIDSLSGMELYAFHRDNVSAFRLPLSKSKNTWVLPKNGNARTNFYDATLLKTPEKTKTKDEISEFYVYPNPVRNGKAKSRFTILANAEYAELEIYDITGLCVFKKKMNAPTIGANEWNFIDLSSLGSDVYTVCLKVHFVSGKIKKKFYRIGVIR